MELRIFNSLRELNRRFYDVHAQSFSETRHTIWPGWLRVSDAIERHMTDHMDMLDVAAGNGRFESFVADRFPSIDWRVACVDPCEDLMRKAQGKLTAVGFGNMSCTAMPLDVLELLGNTVSRNRSKRDASALVCTDQSMRGEHSATEEEGMCISFLDSYDVVTCFGFMHHIYSQDMRERFLKLLIAQAKPGGLVALSFWRFASDEGFAQKAELETVQALQSDEVKGCFGSHAVGFLEPGDYLLGWQGRFEHPRYCHSYTSLEVTELMDSVADRAKLIDRYYADGRTGAMNEYVILQAL